MIEDAWIRIRNQNEMEQLLDLTLGFHDSLTATSNWQSAEKIDESGWLELNGYGILVLKVVSQFLQVPVIELKFEKVRSFRYSYQHDFEPSLSFAGEVIRVELLEWEIEAEGLAFRPLAERPPML